ncbi:ABC transporter substrate-binding protein [Natronorubrum sp. FCH18a]|uniref:ABC transporter substrate-binding protein n=1 Tax=Natronorubrum sp. FCH18a TaxID=3447018 RepID=UPI003F50E8AF
MFYYPLFPVLEERLAENHDVELVTETFAGPTVMTGGFMQGEIDVGYLTPAAITRQRNEGVPVVTIGTVVHQFYHALVVDPSIDGWDDLEGADVAVHEPLTSSTVLTEAMVAEELGSVDAVNYQNILGTAERMASLEAGEVDAIIAFLSGAFQTEADGYGEILSFPWEYDHLSDIPANGWVHVFETAVENDMWPRDYETNMSEERMENSIDLSVELDLLDEDDRTPPNEILDDRFVGEI